MSSFQGRKDILLRLRQSGMGLLDYVFTPSCMGCERVGQHWCATCDGRIKSIPSDSCAICQGEIEGSSPCPDCRADRPSYDALRSLGRYDGPLAKAIVGLKYRPNSSFAHLFLHRLAGIVASEHWVVDFVVPMPQSRRSYLERGYNQVEMFSKPLARLLGVPHGKKQLRRQIDTPSQVGLNLEEREANVRGAFLAEDHLVVGRSFLLVDDVTTSGASLNHSAKALKQAGADHVYGLCLAKADHRRHLV